MRRCWARAANAPKRSTTCESQLKQFAGTSLPERIRKNINLLSLEGKPAPRARPQCRPVARRKPPSLARCAAIRSCSSFGRTGAAIVRPRWKSLPASSGTSSRKGLVVIGPTRLYGYVAGGEDAPPAKEKQYIEEVRREFYAALPECPCR